MKDVSANVNAKKAAGEAAADLVKSGMVVGLGTGSTVAWTIKRWGRGSKRKEPGFLWRSHILSGRGSGHCFRNKIDHAEPAPSTGLGHRWSRSGRCQSVRHKRRRSCAHAREGGLLLCPAVRDSSRREQICGEKLSWPVPVEVLPFAAKLVERRLIDLGGKPVLRLGKMKDGPVITDNGNFVMDVDFGVIVDPKALAARICPIPGVVEHGIFDNLDELYLARARGWR